MLEADKIVQKDRGKTKNVECCILKRAHIPEATEDTSGLRSEGDGSIEKGGKDTSWRKRTHLTLGEKAGYTKKRGGEVGAKKAHPS